jgi:translation initiation factor 3 subunit G
MKTETSEENTTIFISNIPEETTESDIKELCRRFGVINRISCPKDKSGNSKGFAFVTFEKKGDAQKAINTLNGYGYGHLILKVYFATTDT